MSVSNFTEDDKKKLIEFINVVAKNASFTMKTDEIIAYFKLLAHMQNTILPKVEAHILEVIKVIEPEKEPVIENEARDIKKRK